MQQARGLGDETIDQIGSRRGVRLERAHGQRRGAEHLGIGFRQPSAQPRPAQHEHEAVFLDGLDEDVDAGQTDRAQSLGEPHGHFGGDAPRSPVGDAALRVDAAEVAARGDVAGAQVELDAERFEDAATDLKAQRIVAEQTQVSGAAAGCDAGRHVTEQTARGFRGERREIGDARRLELRSARFRPGQSAEPVEREQHDFGRVRHHELADQIEHGVKCTGRRYASLTGLSIEPSASISTRHTSPGCRNTGFGFMANPTPGGVPVAMRSPGESVISPDRYEMR